MRSDVPEGWLASTLGEISDVKRGASPRPIGDPKWFADGGPGWVRIADVTASSKFLRQTTQYLSTEGVACSVIVNPGDLIMSICGTIGRPIFLDMKACIHDGFVLFSDLAPTVSSDFLYTYLQFKAEDFSGKGQPGTQKNLNTGIVKSAQILLPPLAEQRKIAAILTSVDEAIQATEAVIAQTRRVKEGLLQELLTRGIGHTRFKQTEIGEIPESWEVRRLEEIASIQRGRFSHRPRNAPHLYGGDHPFVQTGDIGLADDLLLHHNQTLNDVGLQQSRKFPVGTILLTIAANIGDVALTTYEVACPDSVVGIIPHHVDPLWLLYVLAARKERLDRHAPESAQKNINLETLKPLLIGVPPVEEQLLIKNAISNPSETIREYEALRSSILNLKSGLLQDLLTGRVRVTP